MLPPRVFSVIEKACGFGASARLTELDLRAQGGIGPRSIQKLGLLVELGWLEIQRGPQNRRIFWLSNRWRAVSEASARETIKARGLEPRESVG